MTAKPGTAAMSIRVQGPRPGMSHAGASVQTHAT
jgi:hypothetical protein